MLGDDIALALPEMRAQADSLMVDTCVISRAGTAGTIDEDTGVVSDGEGTTVYEGKCRLQRPGRVRANTTSAGETEWTLSPYELELPTSATGIQNGDAVLVTSTLDADVTDRPFTVTDIERKTHQVMRRVSLEEVT